MSALYPVPDCVTDNDSIPATTFTLNSLLVLSITGVELTIISSSTRNS